MTSRNTISVGFAWTFPRIRFTLRGEGTATRRLATLDSLRVAVPSPPAIRLVSGWRKSSIASVSPCARGGGGYSYTMAQLSTVKQILFVNTLGNVLTTVWGMGMLMLGWMSILTYYKELVIVLGEEGLIGGESAKV